MPTMGPHVISVSALGPSGGKADYSNYGFKYTDVSAPGGYFRDFFGTPQYRQLGNEVLSAYPKHLAQEAGQLNPDGTPKTPARGSCRAARAPSAATTSTCREPRWPRRTPRAWPR